MGLNSNHVLVGYSTNFLALLHQCIFRAGHSCKMKGLLLCLWRSEYLPVLWILSHRGEGTSTTSLCPVHCVGVFSNRVFPPIAWIIWEFPWTRLTKNSIRYNPFPILWALFVEERYQLGLSLLVILWLVILFKTRVCVCVYVCACMHMCAGGHACTYSEKSEEYSEYVPLSLSVMGWCDCTQCFCMSAGIGNSGPYAFTPSTLNHWAIAPASTATIFLLETSTKGK